MKKIKRWYSPKEIYKKTKKPKEYIRVDLKKEDLNLQDLRQLQFNYWSKKRGVYTGSYLPNDPQILLHKGWFERKGKPDKSSRNFERKNIYQVVRWDQGKENQIPHYHWHEDDPKYGKKELHRGYKDRFGKHNNGDKRHLLALDKDCPFKAMGGRD